jgi:8-oxo-dGTP pyrophosphatase MutT (NUDIX family)
VPDIIHVVAMCVSDKSCGVRKYLVGRRAPGRDYEGLWEFPGGKTEVHETSYDTGRREMFEELGLAAEADELIASVHVDRQDAPCFVVHIYEATEVSSLDWDLDSALPLCSMDGSHDLIEAKTLEEIGNLPCVPSMDPRVLWRLSAHYDDNFVNRASTLVHTRRALQSSDAAAESFRALTRGCDPSRLSTHMYRGSVRRCNAADWAVLLAYHQDVGDKDAYEMLTSELPSVGMLRTLRRVVDEWVIKTNLLLDAAPAALSVDEKETRSET